MQRTILLRRIYFCIAINQYEDVLKKIFRVGIKNHFNKMNVGKMRDDSINLYPGRYTCWNSEKAVHYSIFIKMFDKKLPYVLPSALENELDTEKTKPATARFMLNIKN